MRTLLLIAILSFLTWHIPAQVDPDRDFSTTTQDNKSRWVDSTLFTLSLEQKIGQLFMIRAHSDLGPDHIEKVKKEIKEYQVGGLCFFQGTPQKQAILSNSYQELAHIPLLIAIDAEWGLGMRFKENGLSFPRQLMLGAMQNNRDIYLKGLEVANQLKSIGVHVNFAPVVDVNNNPLNPVINDRSFGENRYQVASKSFQYMSGMQNAGLIACAKHFPGHGDTETDSHLDLPVIRHNLSRLDSVELYPFKVLIQRGVKSIMVAHLNVPALDSTPQLPTTLSAPTITSLLRHTLGFEGLIFTDALEMKGVTKHYKPGEIELKAFVAGNDMLVLPEDLPAAFKEIQNALQKQRISENDLNDRVKRILEAKYDAGLHLYKPVDLSQIDSVVYDPKAEALKARLIEQSLTVVRNKADLIPIKQIHLREFGSWVTGSEKPTAFQKRLESYLSLDHINSANGNISPEDLKMLKEKDIVFAGITAMNKYAEKDFGITIHTLRALRAIEEATDLVVVIFGSPYALKFFKNFDHVVVAFQDDPVIQDLAAQGIMGVFPLQGRLPVTACPEFPFNSGLMTGSLLRMGYSVPERVGMRSDTLEKIKDLVKEMIEEGAAPGCQILVARQGRIVYQEEFGHHTYKKKRPVMSTDLYDLASITKVAATSLSVMRMVNQGLIDIENSMGYYLPHLDGTNKSDLIIREVMSHHAGLIPYIPFHEETIQFTKGMPRPMSKYYKSVADTNYTIPVAKNLFLLESYTSQLWSRIIQSELRARRGYRYSDLGFYMLAEMIRNLNNEALDSYTRRHFYQPIGLTHMTFNPHKSFPVHQIVPSEEDGYFRRQRIQGFVHDMGSAMLGGVGGHAGLFSNAHDLAILMQMLMSKGYYGGTEFLGEDVVQTFTTRVSYSTRRAVGFDMKELNSNRKSFTSKLASEATYGHTGFTGTCAWNDPKHDLVFIFLSNRTYPTMRNNKLNKLEIRERIHTLLYRAIFRPEG